MDKKLTALASNPGFLEHFKQEDNLYHYLFPIALGGKYRLERTSLMSFQLDLWGPEIIPSRDTMDPAIYNFEELVEDRRRMNAMARILMPGSDFHKLKAKEDKSDADIDSLAHSMAEVMFGSVQQTETNPFRFKKIVLERMEPEALCRKFAYRMTIGDIDDCIEEEVMFADITQYIAPGGSKRYHKGSYYFWTQHLLNAFNDCGIVKVDASFRHMAFLQWINNY